MDVKQLRNLQEAYNQVYTEEEKWIQKAIKKPGAFTAKAKQHDMSTQEFAAYVDKHPEKFDTTTKKQANLAQTLKGIAKEEVDVYDIILSHLLDEGYAETPEAAEVMMVNMSEEWRDSIVEATKRTEYLQKKFNKENERESGSALKYIPGKQNTGSALQKARESERHMRGNR